MYYFHAIVVCLLAAVLTLPSGCRSDSSPEENSAVKMSNSTLRSKGIEALNIGDWQTARGRFAQAAEQSPIDYQAQYFLGQCELMLGRPVEAQFAFEEALAVRRDDSELTPRILDRLAEAIYRQDRVETLRTFLSQTAEIYGQSRDYLRQARYLFRLSDMDAAKLAYRKAAYFALEGDAGPYLAICDFYASLSDIPNVVLALRYAYHVDPTNPEVSHRLRELGEVPGPAQSLVPPKPELFTASWVPPASQ